MRQVGNASARRKGVRVFGSALLRRKGVRGFGDALDASWLGMEPEGSGLALGARVTTVTFCNPHQHIPESSAPFPSPHAQSRNLTLIPNSEHPILITLDHSRPDCLYLSLVSSSSLSLASSHTLSLPLSRSLHLTFLVLCLRQPYTT